MSPLPAIPPLTPNYAMPQLDVITPFQTPGVDGPAVLNPAAGPNATQAAGESFANVLGRMVQEVNAKQTAASDAVNSLQSGQNVPLHQAVIAMEEANVSFQMMIEVRNHLLDSYQELMRMQI
jgi:flagellar hook-basal body complex protein FliE